MNCRIALTVVSATALFGALLFVASVGVFRTGSSPAFADEASCDAVHPSLVYDIGADECTLDVAIVLNGTHALDHTLHILDQGKITVNTAAGLTLNITGGFIIDTPLGANGTNGINGDVVNAFGRAITINTTEDVLLRGNGVKGATIASSRTGNGDAPGGGGAITINAGPRGADGKCTEPRSGNITMEPGSRVLANTSKATAGAINFNACHTMEIDGLVESSSGQTGSGTATIQGGGPITLIAGCTLTISDTGKVSSRSLDPRGDRVHLEGCDVFIYGIVESVARGHANPQGANGCKGPDRPDKPNGVPLPHYPYTNYSTNCVEVWGKSITIDASGAHNGQVNADSGGGGNGGTGWIELDARENITLVGCSTTVAGDCSPDYYLVHANGIGGSGNSPGEGSLGGEEGGLINVTSTTGGLASSGLVFSAFAGNQGSNSDGGSLIIETNTNTALGTSINDVGGADLRGIISAKSYNGTVMGAAPGLLDTCGSGLGATDGDNTCVPAVPVSPRLVTLQGCGPDNLNGPPNDGVVYTGTTDPTPFTQPNDQCGGAPVVQRYVTLSDCQRCGGQAVKSGVKFEDLDGNGEKDIGEPFLDGWVINVYIDDTPPNGDLDAAEFAAGADFTDTTDVGTGAYSFTLPPGSYIVCEELKTGWFQSAPGGLPAECDGHAGLAPQGHAITLAAGDTDVGNNFGNFRNARKCGVKFHDLNGNGRRDDNEPGLSGWEIFLLGSDGLGNSVSKETNTDEGGRYCFDVPPGSYIVCEERREGWIQSYPLPGTAGAKCDAIDLAPGGYGIVLESGEQDLDNDFGNFQNARKCGVKFHDLDGDGVRDDGEPGLPGWVIHLFGTDGVGTAVNQTTLTDEGSRYCFDVRPGSYTVCEHIPASPPQWFQSYPNGLTPGSADCTGDTHGGTVTPGRFGWAVTLTSGQQDLDNHFGNFQNARKCGVKFHDLDGDGVRDDGEPGLPGWMIHLFGTNGVGTAVNQTTLTDEGSRYCFDVRPGTYTVCEHMPASPPQWFQSYPNGLTPGYADCTGDTHGGTVTPGRFGWAVTLTSGQQDVDNHFGNFQNARKCGVKFHDLDGDGVRDDGEPGLPGWMIHLFGSDGTGNAVNATTLTDEGSRYCFDVRPGTYTVCEHMPASPPQWYQSYPNGLTPGYADCTGDTHGGTVTPGRFGWAVTLTSGQQDLNNDFGNFQEATKSGRKFNDLLGDGINDATDPGLPDWVIHLFGTDGMTNPVHKHFTTCDAADITGNDGTGDVDGNDGTCNGQAVGYYAFSVPPGNYTVCEELQANWSQTYPNPGTDGAACEGHTHIGTPGPYGYGITLISRQSDPNNDFGNARRQVECKWCTKNAVLSQVWQNPGGGDPSKCCLIPDILVDVRRDPNEPLDPVLPTEIGTNQVATNSIQAAIDYVNSALWVDPTPSEEIFIGVTAQDCGTGVVGIGSECEGQTGRGPGGHDGPEGFENVVVTNTRAARMNIFGCSIDIAAADPNKPVVEIKDSVGKVTVLDIHVWDSHVAGYYIHDNDDDVVVKNSRSVGGSGIGYHIADDDVEITGSPHISNNDIGILVDTGSTNVTLRTNNDINSNGVGIHIKGDGNESNGNDVGQLLVVGEGGPNGTGIIVDGKDNHLHGDNVTYNTGDGIVINGSGTSLADGNFVEDEDSQNNGDDGIEVTGGFNTLDRNKQIKFNGGDGIEIGGENGLHNENVADQNTGHGFKVTGNNNKLEKNEAHENGGDGIHVTGDNNLLLENTAEENIGHGIRADEADGAGAPGADPLDNELEDNEGDNNTLQGIRACGQTDSGGNTGSGNGVNPQVDFLCLVAGPPVFFVADDSDNMVYKYDAAGVPAGSFALLAANANATGAAVVGSDVYVLDSADDQVYRYDAATGAHEATSRDLEQSSTAGADLGTPAGLAIDGDNLWIVDDGGNELLQFDLSDAFSAGGSLNAIADIALSIAGNADPRGLAIDADCVYVLDNDDLFYRYDRPEVGTACATATSKALKNEDGDSINTPTGTTMSGTSLWIVDSGDDKAYEYNLSAAGAQLFPGGVDISAKSDFDLDAANDGASGM